MDNPVSHIPVKQSWIENPFESEISYEAWNIAHNLIFESSGVSVADEIRNLYALGYYDAQVKNGGHSQLAYNMDIGELRSSFLFDGFRSGAEMIGASDFAKVCIDFQTWILAKPRDAQDQTGFEGRRAEYLDDLGDRFSELDQAYVRTLKAILEKSVDAKEQVFLKDCLERNGEWSGDLDALTTVWLLSSGILTPVPDNDFSMIIKECYRL